MKDRRRLRPSLSIVVVGLSMVVIAGSVLVGGVRGVVAAVMALIAVPIAGFTYDQIALTRKGRSLATTVEEIRALKSSDEVAFTGPLTALLRLLLHRRPEAPATALEPVGTSRPGPSRSPDVTTDHDPHEVSGYGGGLPRRGISWHRGPDERPGGVFRPTFWEALTGGEQRSLEGRARTVAFHRGEVICREGRPAEHVTVLISGWARVWVNEPDGSRDIAFRGPGDLVGERAVMLVRSRSAMVTAETEICAMQVRAQSFLLFLADHPRVQGVLEREVYDRLTEAPLLATAQAPGWEAAIAPGWSERSAWPEVPKWSGGNCSILLTDIAGFGGHDRDDDDRLIVRESMYEMLQDAFSGSGLRQSDYYQEDRGDGALIVVPPDTPTRSVVDPMLARLAAGLRRHNRRASAATRIQLRAALHVGPVTRDARGVSGASIIQAARLLEAPVLKDRLAETTADLGFIASTFVYETVIQQGPGYVDPACYLPVEIRVKESALTAWMYLAGGSSSLRAV
ncbi:Crp/Fnr family transcriptional regulator [Actinomadura barringtoniae]|nr:cyclic nucleotide-binding domain-containing protein [Actinomadura barringtoniae]